MRYDRNEAHVKMLLSGLQEREHYQHRTLSIGNFTASIQPSAPRHNNNNNAGGLVVVVVVVVHHHHHQQQGNNGGVGSYGAPSQHHYSHQQSHNGGGAGWQQQPAAASHQGGSSGAAPSTLLVTVEQCQYPITDTVLRDVFTRIGVVGRIACAPQQGTSTTATVHFADAATAARAKTEMDGKQIYPNCCIMRIGFQPEMNQHHHHNAAPMNSGGYNGDSFNNQHQRPMPSQYGGQHHHHHHHHQHHAQHNGYNNMPPHNGHPTTLGGTTMAQTVTTVATTRTSMERSRTAVVALAVEAAEGRGGNLMAPGHQHMHQQDGGFGAYNGAQEAPVLIISNVPETVSLHSLWVLLEVYGNVNSLKRQHTHKDNVVALFQNLHDARGAVTHLQSCPFYGNTLNVKHFAGYQDRGASRVEWNLGPATDPLTIAFQFHGNHHRTKPSAPFNPKQKNRPDRNLFVSNLTEEITDDAVKELFASKEFVVLEFYRKTANAAILQLESVDKAVEGLIATHAQQLSGRYIYVAFSRFPPGPPPAGQQDQDQGEGSAPAAELAAAPEATGVAEN
ncbi:RNA-binding protein, putative [Bodo saltans]|uniref:RNA-binding protein, putative n=1 Tax=Bodo saltans TaxID=75058 RepID=A0A0S4KFA7_BODSA|nr:RNA-binding protein, putative [Bodo saltans]|eukprot:CUI14356.1 RNA-binding protein, putative [Bodo saltans]